MSRTDFSELVLTLSTGWHGVVEAEIGRLVSSDALAKAILDFIITGDLTGLNGVNCSIFRCDYRRYVSIDAYSYNVKLEAKSVGAARFVDNGSGDLILTVLDTDGVYDEIHQRWLSNSLFAGNMVTECMFVSAD